MYKLAFVIVTYNRSTMVSSLLKKAANQWKQYDSAAYIMDGSEDLKTKEAVESLALSNVVYKSFPGTSILYRLIEGCAIADAKYICICGDSVTPVFKNYGQLFSALDKDYDLIDFTYRDPQKICQKEYKSIVEMYKELTWDMTHMGNVFFRKESYKLFSSEEYYKKYGNERKIYPFMLKGAVALDEIYPENVPFSLVFGNEATGLDDGWLDVGKSILIPHSKEIDSLNLSLAVGIGLYEFTKKVKSPDKKYQCRHNSCG